MKFLLLKLILFLGFLYPQTSNQVNQAKKLIKERGLSQSQVKDIARSQGYTEQQIENTINNAIFTSRCVFSITFAASATDIEEALKVPASIIRPYN